MFVDTLLILIWVFQNSFQNDAKPILNQGILRKNREYRMYLGFREESIGFVSWFKKSKSTKEEVLKKPLW